MDTDHHETAAEYLDTYNKPRIQYKAPSSSVHKARSLIGVYRTLSLLSGIPHNSLPILAHGGPILCTVGSDRLDAVAASLRRCSTALVFGIWYSSVAYSGRMGDIMSRK